MHPFCLQFSCLCVAIIKLLMHQTHSLPSSMAFSAMVFSAASVGLYGLVFLVDALLARDCYLLCILVNLNRNYKVGKSPE